MQNGLAALAALRALETPWCRCWRWPTSWLEPTSVWVRSTVTLEVVLLVTAVTGDGAVAEVVAPRAAVVHASKPNHARCRSTPSGGC